MASTAKKDVLIVDDDDAIRSLMSVALKRVGLQCEAARDGLDALQQMDEAEYAVVLLDLMMPRLDGMSFLQRLQESFETRVPPLVIVMTAFSDREDLVTAAGLVQAVVQKPFDIHELAEIVRDCVTTRRSAEFQAEGV